MVDDIKSEMTMASHVFFVCFIHGHAAGSRDQAFLLPLLYSSLFILIFGSATCLPYSCVRNEDLAGQPQADESWVGDRR